MVRKPLGELLPSPVTCPLVQASPPLLAWPEFMENSQVSDSHLPFLPWERGAQPLCSGAWHLPLLKALLSRGWCAVGEEGQAWGPHPIFWHHLLNELCLLLPAILEVSLEVKQEVKR